MITLIARFRLRQRKENYGTKQRKEEAVRDVELARTLAGFHFRNSCLQGANLGRTVGRYVAKHYFQPVHRHR